MPDDLAAAVIADGGEFMNRTLETIERVTPSRRHNLERKVIIVAAHFTLSHPGFPPQISQITQIDLCNMWITYDFLLRAELIDCCIRVVNTPVEPVIFEDKHLLQLAARERTTGRFAFEIPGAACFRVNQLELRVLVVLFLKEL